MLSVTDELTIPPTSRPLPKPATGPAAVTGKPTADVDFDETTVLGTPIPGHVSSKDLAKSEITILDVISEKLKLLMNLNGHRMRAIIIKNLPAAELKTLSSKEKILDYYNEEPLSDIELRLQAVISSNPHWEHVNAQDVYQEVKSKKHLAAAKGVGSNSVWKYLNNNPELLGEVLQYPDSNLAWGVGSNINWNLVNSETVYNKVFGKNTALAEGVGSNLAWQYINPGQDAEIDEVLMEVIAHPNTKFARGVGSNLIWKGLNSQEVLNAVIADPKTLLAEAVGANPYWQHLDDPRVKEVMDRNRDSKLDQAVKSNPKKVLMGSNIKIDRIKVKGELEKIPEPQNHFVYKVLKDCGIDLLAA